MDTTNPKSVAAGFAAALSGSLGSKNSLLITMSSDPAVGLLSAKHCVTGPSWSTSVSDVQRYDFIVADLPLGLRREKIELGGSQINVRQNWAELANALNLLELHGTCLALIEPPAFGIAEGPKYEDALNREGYFLNGIFNTPAGILSATSIQPVLVVLSKRESKEVFVAELDSAEQAHLLATAFTANSTGSSLGEGVSIEPGTFTGFSSLRATQQLAKLETQYKEYDSVRLGDIAEEVNIVRSGQQHEGKENSIYIPMIGTSAATHDIGLVTIKHHNLCQVVLCDRANSEYLSAFFRSDLGKLVLNSLTFGAVIPKIKKSDLIEARVALPRIAEQREIASTHRKLSSLLGAISDFQTEMALNPRSAAAIKEQLDSMLVQLGGLTDADRVMSLVRSGESQTVEFKESFSLDVRKGSKEKYIELSALKTVVAFLNTSGGCLIVGVSDSGDTVGIENEVETFYKSNDSYLLHFKNQIKQRIGEQYYPFINHRLVSVAGTYVLMVECDEALQPCYLDGKDFYVRTNPATDKLEGPKLVEYVQNHFKS